MPRAVDRLCRFEDWCALAGWVEEHDRDAGAELVGLVHLADVAARERWSERRIAQALKPLPRWVAERWWLDAITQCAGNLGASAAQRGRVRRALQELTRARRMTAHLAQRVGLYKFRARGRPRGGYAYQYALTVALRRELDWRDKGRKWSTKKVAHEATYVGVVPSDVHRARADARSWADDISEALDGGAVETAEHP